MGLIDNIKSLFNRNEEDSVEINNEDVKEELVSNDFVEDVVDNEVVDEVINNDYEIKSYISDFQFKNSDILRIDFAGNLAEIGKEAFIGCDKLEIINFNTIEPPVIGLNAFVGVTGATVNVPKGSFDNYLNTANVPNPNTNTYKEV